MKNVHVQLPVASDVPTNCISQISIEHGLLHSLVMVPDIICWRQLCMHEHYLDLHRKHEAEVSEHDDWLPFLYFNSIYSTY